LFFRLEAGLISGGFFLKKFSISEIGKKFFVEQGGTKKSRRSKTPCRNVAERWELRENNFTFYFFFE